MKEGKVRLYVDKVSYLDPACTFSAFFAGEPEFLKFVKGAMEWRKKWHYAEMERQRLNVIVTERENELAGKDHQVLKRDYTGGLKY